MSTLIAEGSLHPLGYQQLTSLATAVALTIPTDARIALIQAETKNVRWRSDGTTTAPTTSVGMILFAGTDMLYTGDLTTLKFIETESAAKLNVTYFG